MTTRSTPSDLTLLIPIKQALTAKTGNKNIKNDHFNIFPEDPELGSQLPVA